jgi:hypothetical protein
MAYKYLNHKNWYNKTCSKDRKLTLNQLKRDLINKFNEDKEGFKMPFFKKDKGVAYHRRSFNDLYSYYRYRGVSEKKLLKALIEAGFRSRYCPYPRRIVFWKASGIGKPKKLYHSEFYRSLSESIERDDNLNNYNFGKYKPSYLEKLYDEIFEN